MSGTWHVLGFDADAIVLAHQDARLAGECFRAWLRAGRPAACHILEAAGEGKHLVYWFVNDAAAVLLDAAGVRWRNLIVAASHGPKTGHAVLVDRQAG